MTPVEKNDLFITVFNSENGMKVLKILHEEAFDKSGDLLKDGMAFAYEAGKISLWNYIAGLSSIPVRKVMDQQLKELING
jgi:hypothetical protein